MAVAINDIVDNIDDLVSLPGIFVRINQMINDPACTVTQLGEVLSQDPGLTVRLLRIANSPLYGLSTEVDTATKAVTVIGLQRVRDLVLATSAVEAFEGIPNDLLTMDNFWLHSIYCGLIAKFLAAKIKLAQSESLFVAGLLHDFGHLVMFSRIPELARQALELEMEGNDDIDLYRLEQNHIGFDHAMIGGSVATHWQLPAMLVETIRYHHEPEKAKAFAKQTAIVHIANSLAVLAELNATELSETDAPAIHPYAWEITQLDNSVIAPALDDAKQKFAEMRALLLS